MVYRIFAYKNVLSTSPLVLVLLLQGTATVVGVPGRISSRVPIKEFDPEHTEVKGQRCSCTVHAVCIPDRHVPKPLHHSHGEVPAGTRITNVLSLDIKCRL